MKLMISWSLGWRHVGHMSYKIHQHVTQLLLEQQPTAYNTSEEPVTGSAGDNTNTGSFSAIMKFLVVVLVLSQYITATNPMWDDENTAYIVILLISRAGCKSGLARVRAELIGIWSHLSRTFVHRHVWSGCMDWQQHTVHKTWTTHACASIIAAQA